MLPKKDSGHGGKQAAQVGKAPPGAPSICAFQTSGEGSRSLTFVLLVLGLE